MTEILDPETGLLVPATAALPSPPPASLPPETFTQVQAAPPAPVDMSNATPLYESMLPFFPFSEVRAPQVRGLEAWSNAITRGKTYAIMELPTGAGKCFAPGTPILMFDGSIVPVETVRAGDLLMGPDSTPRQVLTLSQGEDEMYRVIPTKGMSYVVNSQHVLALKMTQDKAYLPTGHATNHKQLVDISVPDYLARSLYFKHCAKGYRVGVEFPEQAIPLDPYFVGLWLGDGNSKGTGVTTADPEIVDYLKAFAASHDLVLTPYNNGSLATTYNISTGSRCGSNLRNPVLNALTSMKTLRNKHIPDAYCVNTRETRLQLLAGYLDADGSLSKGGFDFISISERLAEDVAFVARSLGLACYISACKKGCQTGAVGLYYRGHITGNTAEIPCKILRKQAKPRIQKKDHLVTGIHVTPIGRGRFFGFEVDGDHRFLLGDFTVAHNSGLSWTIGSHAASLPAEPRHQRGAYILTTQKALQAQYMRDFASKGMVELMGAANYRCHDYNTDCQTGTLLRQSVKKSGGEPTTCQSCEYKQAKERFAMSEVGVTNFAYFLSEAKYIRRLVPRSVLIIDEAHNAESQVLGQVEIEITRARCEDLNMTVRPPRIPDGAILDARAWVLDNFLPAVDTRIDVLNAQIATTELHLRGQFTKQLAAYEQFASRIHALDDVDAVKDWFCNTDEKTGTLKLRPLTAANFAHDALFRMGHRVLFLSATILDAGAFSRGLGLTPADGGFCRVESDFPVENRPLHFYPIGSMSYKNKEATTPKMLRFIKRILDKHPHEKGIIHTQSYALTKIIKEYLDETEHSSRLVVPEAGFQQRKAGLLEHHESTEPTVLLSPSMTEGLDLYGDLSRFQIIPKVPYPSLGDPFIKARMEHDERWYGWTTALALVQATGRSIRSREDSATTYVLDSDFNNFMARCSGILPQWWKNAIIYH